jgi:hypothetical protein
VTSPITFHCFRPGPVDAACPCNREVLAAGRGKAIAFNVGIESVS